MTQLSTKPYLVRAIYEWCCDSGLTPYLAVKVDSKTRVPMAYVKDGEIVISLGMDAVKDLHLGSDSIACAARFGGVSHAVMIPMGAVIGIFAKESGQGLVFQAGEQSPEGSSPKGSSKDISGHDPLSNDTSGDQPPPNRPVPSKPKLKIVK